MTTNAEILDLAMSRLGGRSSVRVRADVLLEINSAIDTLERGTFFPWFLEKTDTLSFVADDTFKALASDFAIEAEETRPYYVEEGKVFYLTKRFYGTLVGEVPTGVKFYAIRGSDFHIRLAADKAYSILVPYYGRETGNLVDDGADVSNAWLIDAKDWVLAMALRTVAAVHLQNPTQATMFAQMEAKAKTDLYVFHEARINTNQDFVVGGSSDGTLIS